MFLNGILRHIRKPKRQKEKKPPEEPRLTEGERMLLDLFRQVPEDKRKLVLQMIEVALKTK